MFENTLWFGTSISIVLDKKKFKQDTNTNLKFVKAYGIKAEDNQRFPESNFTDTVPRVLEKENPEAIILQTGSIEISNFDVKKALMDPEKSIEEWTLKVKADSNNLFNLAKRALQIRPSLDVIIVKRLPRYDSKAVDPIHIKQSLSEFANSVYDQLWLEGGAPNNIHIVSFDNMECYGYLKDIVY